MFAYDFTFFDQFPLNILVIWKYGSFIVALFGYQHFQNFENQFFKDEKTLVDFCPRVGFLPLDENGKVIGKYMMFVQRMKIIIHFHVKFQNP